MKDTNFQPIIEAISKNAQMLIWSVKSDCTLDYFNDNFKDFYAKFGFQEINLGDKVLFEKFENKIGLQIHEYYQEALSGQWFTKQIIVKLSKGIWGTYEVHFNPIMNESSKVVGIVCVANDISAIKRRKEMLMVQNQLLKEIVYVSSHETRIPIANIIGISDILGSLPIENEETKKYIGFLDQESKRLDDVVRKIVNLITLYDLQEFMDEDKLTIS